MNPTHLLNSILPELRLNHPHLLTEPDGVLVITREDAMPDAEGGPRLKLGAALAIRCLKRDDAITMLRMAAGEAAVADFTSVQIEPGYMLVILAVDDRTVFATFPRSAQAGTLFTTWAQGALHTGLPGVMAKYPLFARANQKTHVVAIIAPDSVLASLLPADLKGRLAGIEAAGAPYPLDEVIGALARAPDHVLSEGERAATIRDLRASVATLPPGHVTVIACRGKTIAIGVVRWEAPGKSPAVATPIRKTNAPGGSA